MVIRLMLWEQDILRGRCLRTSDGLSDRIVSGGVVPLALWQKDADDETMRRRDPRDLWSCQDWKAEA